jgi:hypothetical protein
VGTDCTTCCNADFFCGAGCLLARMIHEFTSPTGPPVGRHGRAAARPYTGCQRRVV